MSMSLTPRQSAALAFIRQYMAENAGRAPSCAEIAAGIDLLSKSGAVRLLNGLVERGHLRRIAHRTRAMELVETAPAIDVAALADRDLRALAGRVDAELQRRAGA